MPKTVKEIIKLTREKSLSKLNIKPYYEKWYSEEELKQFGR